MLILLTPETKLAIELLIIIERRLTIIPKENPFVFAGATKGSMDHLIGWDCVSSDVKEIEGSL